MKSAEQWLNEYSKTHRHPRNRALHMICVPLIFWSIVAFLWSLPQPFNVPFGNWAGIAFLPAFVFYCTLGFRYALTMLLMFAACGAISEWLLRASAPLSGFALAIFAAAWIGQFVGHKYEGAKPAFLDDVVFLLIGPLWTVEKWRRG